MKTDIHKQIRVLLASGHVIYSFALGRVGQVMAVRDSPTGFDIEICPKSRTYNVVKRHRHQHGVTTFLRGDAVRLDARKDTDGKVFWVVVNIKKGKWQ